MIKLLKNIRWQKVISKSNLFDPKFYLFTYPDVRAADIDPIKHYVKYGASEGRNPNREFDTNYYLKNNPDIAESKVNPLAHYILSGKDEGRACVKTVQNTDDNINKINKNSYSYSNINDLAAMSDLHKVSVIIPNYNHARFLKQRIDSILCQTYKNFEILILDDCSTDESKDIIQNYVNNYSNVKCIFNDKNSGNVFKQWRKGIENSDGSLVWICESDDYCENNFLEQMVELLNLYSVNIAFGRIQFADLEGNFMEGLDDYREKAEPEIWGETLVRPAKKWFSNAFGINNVIANVGGCVFRRQNLGDDVWKEVNNYNILGDWFLYCHIANGGMVAYEPKAIAYFRQHGRNTSVNSFKTAKYYEEHNELMKTIKKHWDIPQETTNSFLTNVEGQYRYFNCEDELGPVRKYLKIEDIYHTKKEKIHVLVAVLGFHSGGGELFPIHLANQLQKDGCIVSLFAYDMYSIQKEMYEMLDKRISVYDVSYVEKIGVEKFLNDTGVSVIHSHMASLDAFFINKLKAKIPYIVSLHGSYEATDLPEKLIETFSKSVCHWVYTADKNLKSLEFLHLSDKMFTKLPNAMMIDNEPFPETRKELGIEDNAIVFTLVARGIKRKGWRASIYAFIRLMENNPHISMHLLLCGDGEEIEKYKIQFGNNSNITFLGYQSKIYGLYRMSDCAIVPTRFAGESYPLCIIQAMQVGLPIIGTDIGEIKNMTISSDKNAGILIPNERNTEFFIDHLEKAMSRMLDNDVRQKYAKDSHQFGEAYDIGKISRKYIDLYKSIITNTVY